MSLSGFRVLFVDTVHAALQERLEQVGATCTDGTSWDRETTLERLPDFEGLVIRSRFKLDPTMLDRATSLKFIARSGAGLENIDTAYAAQKGIQLFHAPEGNRDAVGEHALGMLLMLFNHLHRADREIRSGQWNREGNRGIELKGKTVGIIGYGNMGGAFAQRLAGFGCRVLAYDKYKTGFSDAHAQEVSLETLFQEAEVLSLHVPLTEETRFLVNRDFLARFEHPIYLINTARGPVVHTADLLHALETDQVLGACLDVLEFEGTSFEQLGEDLPEAFRQLLQSEKVVLSPHVGGWTHESYKKLSTVLADKILRYFA